MNEQFTVLIKEAMGKRRMTVNKLATETKVSRDRLYRYLNRENESIHSAALATVFEYLGIRVIGEPFASILVE